MKISYKKKLENKIKTKKCKVGIIGLGYVGLPIAILLAKKNFQIIGIDKNKSKIKSLNNEKSYLDRIDDKKIRLLKKSSFFTSDFKVLQTADVIIISVPTPLTKKGKPNLEFIEKSIKDLTPFITKGKMIILESTSYPGTTERYLVSKVRKSFVIGKEVFVGFSSERINPGQNEYSINKIPKVISGKTSNCLELMRIFYTNFFEKIVPAKSIEVAEFSKLLENIYRSVNIGFVNEMKFVSDKMKMDIFDILDIASTKPFGFRRFNPSPGVGGHCIPIDPNYLYWRAKDFGIESKFIKLSADTNKKATNFVVNKIIKVFKRSEKKIHSFSILLLGLSYKKNIDDYRESASIDVLKYLANKGFKNIKIVEPYLKSKLYKLGKTNFENLGKNFYSRLNRFDLVMILTDHDEFNYKKILQYSKKIIDCRGRYPTSNKVERG